MAFGPQAAGARTTRSAIPARRAVVRERPPGCFSPHCGTSAGRRRCFVRRLVRWRRHFFPQGLLPPFRPVLDVAQRPDPDRTQLFRPAFGSQLPQPNQYGRTRRNQHYLRDKPKGLEHAPYPLSQNVVAPQLRRATCHGLLVGRACHRITSLSTVGRNKSAPFRHIGLHAHRNHLCRNCADFRRNCADLFRTTFRRPPAATAPP